MQLNLIKIGNSRGVRLPQNIIKQCGFKDAVEVELVDHSLVLKALGQSRINWEKLFKSEADTEDSEKNEVLAISNRWDEEEWEW
jgi:antitoxin MazE